MRIFGVVLTVLLCQPYGSQAILSNFLGFLGLYACYENELPENLQCYHAWYNTIFHLPESPSEQNITFSLYKGNGVMEDLIAGDADSITASTFDFNLDTKILIHGFISGVHDSWIFHIGDEFLSNNYNVIALDWNEGAGGPNYFQAAANTRVVGATAAYLSLTLEELGYDRSRIHCVGHSLGAHICGYIGKALDGQLGRITGMDPAAPLFDGTGDTIKLTKKDALFVDVIHSDASPHLTFALGSRETNAHADFFPNQGYAQPGCAEDKFSVLDILTLDDIADIAEESVCNHGFAHESFLASIRANTFPSFPCDSPYNFCHECGEQGCCSMGYLSDAVCSGTYILYTRPDYPYDVLFPPRPRGPPPPQ